VISTHCSNQTSVLHALHGRLALQTVSGPTAYTGTHGNSVSSLHAPHGVLPAQDLHMGSKILGSCLMVGAGMGGAMVGGALVRQARRVLHPCDADCQNKLAVAVSPGTHKELVAHDQLIFPAMQGCTDQKHGADESLVLLTHGPTGQCCKSSELESTGWPARPSRLPRLCHLVRNGAQAAVSHLSYPRLSFVKGAAGSC
jgi:hypothetical protein